MAVTEESIGPFAFRFNLHVKAYILSSPNSSDRTCLEAFFNQLRNGPITVKLVRVGATIVILRCNHIITLLNNGIHVDAIVPAPVPVP
jgi:hypothetical protein